MKTESKFAEIYRAREAYAARTGEWPTQLSISVREWFGDLRAEMPPSEIFAIDPQNMDRYDVQFLGMQVKLSNKQAPWIKVSRGEDGD